MQKFEAIESRYAILPVDNVDTDQIIPARFLKTISKDGLGDQLFFDWRYEADGSPKPDFVLNTPEAKQCKVLVAGDNFGCGSSREHAPIAIKAAGISCVVAKSFARIFYRNAFNMGLPIFESRELPDAIAEQTEITVDSAKGSIVPAAGGKTFTFSPIPPFMEQLIADGGLMTHIMKGKAK